jgi:hypothetical protein
VQAFNKEAENKVKDALYAKYHGAIGFKAWSRSFKTAAARMGYKTIPATYDTAGNCAICGDCGDCPGHHIMKGA